MGKNEIIERLAEKSAIKLQVYEYTLAVFKTLKKIAREINVDIRKEAQKINKKMSCSYREKSEFEAELKIAGDLLLFTMHTNIFEFPRDHAMQKTSYVQQDPTRSFCGIIYIYNFLADSFKYNRLSDVGYLVGRIFINREKHFFVEGKRQLGFLFNNFINDAINEEKIRSILESAILYSIDFDLLLPVFDSVKEVTVQDMVQHSQTMSLKTGKRLGFRFEADYDKTE